MDLLNKIKKLISTDDSVGNPLGIPSPESFSVLMLGAPEDIIKQYISMKEKTHDLFQYAINTGSVSDYMSAIMRYSAYSTAAIYGVNLFFANHKLGVTHLDPERLNRLLYGKLLFDIADFGWVMLVFNAEQFHMTERFGADNVLEFLKNDHVPEMYWTLLFSFIVDAQNAEFAYQKFRSQVEKYQHFEPRKLEQLPSLETQDSFNEMVEIGLIGDPNEWRLFDAKRLIDVIGMGPDAIEKTRVRVENSTIARILEPEIRLHLISSW